MDANVIAQVLPNVNGSTIRAATDLMSTDQLLQVIINLDGDPLMTVLNNTRPDPLASVAVAAPWSVAGGILSRLDSASLGDVMDRICVLDSNTFNAAIQRLDIDRLRAVFPRLDATTLQAAVNIASADQLSQILPNLSASDVASTIRAATDDMDTSKLVDIIGILDGAPLMTVLNNTRPDPLARVVIAAPWSMGSGILGRLDIPTLADVMDCICRLDSGTFASVIQRLDLGRLIAVFPVLDNTTLLAAVDAASGDQLSSILPYLSASDIGSTIRAATDHMDTAKLVEIIRILDGAPLMTVLNNTRPDPLARVVFAAPWSMGSGILGRLDIPTLADVMGCICRLDSGTFASVIQRLDLNRLIAVFPSFDNDTLGAALRVMDANLIAQVLPNVNGSTIRAATDLMSSNQLLQIIIILDGAPLMTVLNHTQAQSLVPVVEAAEWPVAMGIIHRLSPADVNYIINHVDPHTRQGILTRL
jgi:Mg/Co/Ni transporter MgtE